MTAMSDVLFRREGALGRITLNRPKALNALTHGMCAAMLEQLTAWADDSAVGAVLIDAMPGRAFCAGGDIRALYESGRAGGAKAREFFATEYRLNAAIRNFRKPYIAAIDGICMGGGVGVTIHGSHRAASENAVFAMPETAIGLFPDIGATYFLPRLPGEIGMYLALTALRLNAAEMVYADIATHFVPAARQSEIAERLARGDDADAALAELSTDPGSAPLAERRAAIDRAFSQDSVEAILDTLRAEGAWGEEMRHVLLARSPLSLKTTFRALREGERLDFPGCQQMEYRIAARMVESHDFLEGVRATVIDKDQTPRWRPDTLSAVKVSEIVRFLSPLDGEPKL